MKIEIRNLDILVDGVKWGSVDRDSHGPRGISYTFRDITGHHVRFGGVPPHPARNPPVLRIRSKLTNQTDTPFAERVVAALQNAIDDGRLLPPDRARQKKEVAERNLSETLRLQREQEHAALSEHAAELLRRLGLETSPIRLNAVIESFANVRSL